jgi:protein O-mannosyl-transferase
MTIPAKHKKSSPQKNPQFQAQSSIMFPFKIDLRIPAGIALVIAATFIAFFPSSNGGFILDDDHYLTENQIIKATDGPYRFWCTSEPPDYWPIGNTMLWIEWRLWDINPIGYHVANLILHVTEVLLIWIILRKLSIPGAFLMAMIFAVHPVNVESVAWIAQRKDMLAFLFFLLSILWYLKADMHMAIGGMAPACSNGGLWEREKTFSSFILHPSSFHFWYCLSLAAFGLAMLSKGSVAILPVLLLGIVWWLRSLTRRDLLRIAPFFLLALVLTVVNIWFQTHGKNMEYRNAGFTERLLGAGCVPWFYLYKALLPIDLAFIYPQWHIEVGEPLWWLPLSASLIVTAVLWWFRKGWSRPLVFAWGFFCVSLLPVMGFTDVGFMKHSLVADHYQHIAILGVIALAAAGWSIWRQRERNRAHWVTTAFAVAAIGSLAFLTWRQSAIYHNAISLYQATLQKNPDCWFAHNCLGCQLDKIGRLQEAIEQFEQALLLKPDYANAHNKLGTALVEAGRLQEAIEHYEKALQLNPDDIETHNDLGVALVGIGRLQEAIEQYRKALKLEPDYIEARNNLGVALVDADLLQEAIEQYQQALRSKPDYADAHNNLGFALIKAGRLQEAIEHLEQALKLKPDHANAHNNLGVALANIDRLPEAIEHYQQVLRLKPGYAYLYLNLAMAYAKMHQSSDAISAAQKGIELARSNGQQAQSEQIEKWLNSYRARLPVDPNAPSAPGAVSQPNN